MGLDRQINTLVGYTRFLLNTEQKKSDFKPEDERQAISAKSNVSAFLNCAAIFVALGLCESYSIYNEDAHKNQGQRRWRQLEDCSY